MESERVVIQSPLSFVGSARRIWKLTNLGPPWVKVLTIPTAVALIALAGCFVAIWTVVFGVLLVPWRLLRRGQRRRKQDALRHQELIAAQRH